MKMQVERKFIKQKQLHYKLGLGKTRNQNLKTSHGQIKMSKL